MNRKFEILFIFVLLLSAVFLSACQSEIGARVNKNIVDNKKDNKLLDVSEVIVNCGTCRDTSYNDADCTATVTQGQRGAIVTCNPADACSGSCSGGSLSAS